MDITVETQCAHCSEPMTLRVDSDMNVRVEQAEARPMVFTPDVEVWDTGATSIIDDF